MKALLLLSGGFDSPVAGYLMKEQGIDISAVHFSSQPLTDDSAEEKSRLLAKMIGAEKFLIVPFGHHLGTIAKNCLHRYYYILIRRLMWRVAEKIAKKEGCTYLITGENLGQVGSQTVENMFLTDKAVTLPILRPVLSYDKQEIINLAKKIGTHDASLGPELCCLLGPKNPATKGRIKIVNEEEKKLDILGIVKKAVEETHM